MDQCANPPIFTRLEYRFDGWLGDALLESFPCFIITEIAKSALEEAGYTGIHFGAVEITKSKQFFEVNGQQNLPKFMRLYIEGVAGQDDFGLTSNHRLVVSERALRTLRAHGLSHAVVTEWLSKQ